MGFTRTAVVTGATQGLGKVIVEALKMSGHTVSRVDRDEADLSQLEAAEVNSIK